MRVGWMEWCGIWAWVDRMIHGARTTYYQQRRTAQGRQELDWFDLVCKTNDILHCACGIFWKRFYVPPSISVLCTVFHLEMVNLNLQIIGSTPYCQHKDNCLINYFWYLVTILYNLYSRYRKIRVRLLL